MLKENLLSILAALGEVQGKAKDEEQAALVRGCRDNLRAAAEQAEALDHGRSGNRRARYGAEAGRAGHQGIGSVPGKGYPGGDVMARIKPDPHVVENRAQCEGALAEMAALDRKLSAIENEMRETVDGAKTKAGQLAGPLQARRKELADAVAVFARLNRQELFAKSKSLDMGFGVIGFRASTKIVQIRGITAEMTLEKLHQYNLSDGIRTKEEINKDAALGWPDERLELVGLKRQQSDTFFIEISKENVPQGTA